MIRKIMIVNKQPDGQKCIKNDHNFSVNNKTIEDKMYFKVKTTTYLHLSKSHVLRECHGRIHNWLSNWNLLPASDRIIID